MRGGALALGLTGGIIGLIAAVLALTVGGIGQAIQDNSIAQARAAKAAVKAKPVAKGRKKAS
jgi:hypothetical protein